MTKSFPIFLGLCLDGGLLELAALFESGDGPGEVGDGNDEETADRKIYVSIHLPVRKVSQGTRLTCLNHQGYQPTHYTTP